MANVNIIDNLALIPLTQTEVVALNLQSLGVISIMSSTQGDMLRADFATINPMGGFVDKAITATKVPYSGLTNLPGGTTLFLRADGSFAQPPDQLYSLVSTGLPGLVNVLPSSGGFNYYLAGDGGWKLFSTGSLPYSQLTGVPTSFIPIPHAARHITTNSVPGSDPIGLATTSTTGLVPQLPSNLGTLVFHRGDNAWAPIPTASGSAPGLIPVLPATPTVFLNGTGNFSTPNFNQLTGLPSPLAFTPTVHGSTHTSLGSDPIPLFAIGGSASGLVPGSNAGSVNFLRADGVWAAPTGQGSLASTSGAGLLQQLPPLSSTSYYLGGDNSFHTVNSLLISFSQLTSVPIFTGGSAGLVPNSVGGSVAYLRADGTFNVPPGAIVTTSSIGTVQQLPSSSGSNYYLNGINVWTLISSLSIAYSQITPGTLPSSFVPSPHAATHEGPSGSDIIGPPTVAHTGLVPILLSSNQTFNFLRGDSSWSVIPIAGPNTSGLVPSPPNVQNQWFRGDGQFALIPNVNSTSPGLVAAYPNNTTTFLNGQGQYTSVDYTSGVTGKPLTFSPALHAAQHITGGGDIIPVFTALASGLVPIAGSAGTYLSSSGGWTTPSGAGDVLHTETLTGVQSISGGGDLSTPRTFNLVGDQTTPGNSQFYGTNPSGSRGWYATNTQPIAVTGTPGLVPTPTGFSNVFLSGVASFSIPPTFASSTPGYAPASGGGSINFLRADATWQPIPGTALASTSASGLVPTLNATLSQPNYYLRGDDTWQLISQIAISFSQVTGVPTFSGTPTAGLVPGSTGLNTTFLSGDGTFHVPSLAQSAAPGYIANLPASAGSNFWARGDNSWQLLPNYVVVSSQWTMPAVGLSVAGVIVNNAINLTQGMTVFTGGTGTQCFMEISNVGAGNSLTLVNRGYAINPSVGTFIPGGLMEVVGPGVAASLVSGFVPTPSGVASQYLSGTGVWSVPTGSAALVTTQFSVSGNGSVGSPIQLVNDSSSPGSFKFYSTNAFGTLGWFPLTYSWETNGTFSMPGIGGTQNVLLFSNTGMTVGSTVVIEDNSLPPNQAFLEVISVNGDGLHVVLNNRGYAFNANGGAVFAGSAAVTLAGPGIAANGVPGFVPPNAFNDTFHFLRADGSWSVPGNVTNSNPGYVPSTPNDPTQFLNGTGLFSVPSVGALAILGTSGAVAGLPASNESTSVLRGDNTWVLMSTLSSQIAYASLSGLPATFAPSAHATTHLSTGADPLATFSTTTTVSGVVVGSNSLGNTFFLRADGTWATPPSGPGNASAGTAGLVVGLISSPTLQYLRGDNSWQPISGLAVAYGNLTGTPATFTPSTHASTHLDNGTDPIAVVAGSRTGLVPVLSGSAPTTKFLRGDATWTVVPNFATGAVTPGLVVGSNSAGNTNFLRADNTWNPIQAVTTSVAGLAPILPASNAINQFLNGSGTNGTWVTIPFYWNITTSFTQPATSGNASGVVFTSTTGLLAGATIVTIDSGNLVNYYTVFSITDPTHAVLTNIGATGNTAAASTVNPGTVNLAGPPVMTATGGGIVPIPPNLNTEYLDGTGNWSIPPSSGVTNSRLVNTQFSLTGGGDLSANRVLNLVGDTASPAGYSVYGTNTGGTRGWYLSTAFPVATTSAAGLLPTLPTSSPTTVFLRGDGTFTAPAGLSPASGSAAGIVPILPATPPAAPTTVQWLRADNTWQFLPDSNSTTASWTMPAIGSTVSGVTFTSTSNWDAGMTLFFATGSAATCCYMEVTTVTDGTHLVLTNRGYVSNPVATTSIPVCLSFVVSPGVAQVISSVGYSGLVPTPPNTLTTFLRGDATFAVVQSFSGTTTAGLVPGTSGGSTTTFLRGDGTFAVPAGSTSASTTAGANFTWPAVGSFTSSILVVSSTLMTVGCAVYVPAFGVAEVKFIADGTHCVLQNNGNVGNALSGTVLSGTGIYIGTAGALATGTSSGMIPVLPADSTKVLLGTGVFGTLAYSSLGSIPSAPPLHATTHITGGTDVIGPPTTSVSGLAPILSASNATNKWLRGDATWQSGPALAITTTSTFTWPAFGGSVLITVDSTANMKVGMALYFPALGVAEVLAASFTGTTLTIRNNGNTGNAGSTAGVSIGTYMYVGGGGALATSTSSGDINPIGATSLQFLNGTAVFSVPTSVTTSNPGYVPTAPANASNFLNGLTGTWTAVPYSVITGTPVAATSTTSGLVPTPPNNTYQYLRGDATFVTPPFTTVTTAGFTQVAIGSNTASIAVESSGWMFAGMVLIVGTGSTWNYMTVVSKADTTHVVLTNIQGATVSGTIASGAIIKETGTPIAVAASTSTAGLLPAPNNTVTTFLNGQLGYTTPPSVSVSAPGYAPTASAAAGTFLNGNTGLYSTPPSATSTVAGYVPTPPNNTVQFLRGDATFAAPGVTTTSTSGTFAIPASGSTVAVSIVACTWPIVGQKVYISDGGGTNKMFGMITVVSNSTSITVLNTGDTGNAVSGTMGTPAGVALVDYQSVVWDKFTAMDNDPPSTLYATFDVVNNISTLGFNDSATWGAVFKSVLPQFAALGSGIIVHIKWASVSAVTGAAVFGAAYERMNLTFNSDHFGTQVTATTTTSGTAGVLNDTSITIPYANMGSTVSGDPYRLQIQRIGANGADTLVGNAEVLFVTVESGVL